MNNAVIMISLVIVQSIVFGKRKIHISKNRMRIYTILKKNEQVHHFTKKQKWFETVSTGYPEVRYLVIGGKFTG